MAAERTLLAEREGQKIVVEVKSFVSDSKIWVEEDWTEEGIADALVKAGVPNDDIVLAFHPPQVRHNTSFAVA